MARSQRKRRGSVIRIPKNIEVIRMYGNEPDWTNIEHAPDSDEYVAEYKRALNWGNACFDDDSRKELFIRYAKENLSNVEGLGSIPSWKFKGIGITAWLLLSECRIPEDSLVRFREKCDSLLGQPDEKKEENFDNVSSTKSVAERELSKRNSILHDIDVMYMEESVWCKSAKKAKLEVDSDAPYNILQATKPTQTSVRYIADYFSGILSDLNGINSDPQLKEGYSHVSKTALANRKKWLQSIIDQCETFVSNTRSSRKPRKRKLPSIDKKVGGVKYLKESDEYKLKSVDPSSIIGSSMILIFNTKSRKIGLYKAKTEMGLDIKGTTLQNWDVETSVQKILRKPEEQLASFRGARSKRCEILIDKNINAKPFKMNGRLNSDIIIMKAYT